MKIFVYKVDKVEQDSRNYLIYYQDNMYKDKWKLIGVGKCPTKKITHKFIRRFPNFISNAPKGSIGKPSFSYENSQTIYILIQSYDINTLTNEESLRIQER